MVNLRSPDGIAILHERIFQCSEQFADIIRTLESLVHEIGSRHDEAGLADSPRLILQTMANQVFGEFQDYYEKSPESECDAICWLQKAFVLCRMFGSEQYLEKPERAHVGKMVDPDSQLSFGELTSADRMPESQETYGKVVFNLEQQHKINSALAAGSHTQALKLICDSVKHGVLSTAINLSATKTSRQVYLIGLMAMLETVDHYNMRLTQRLADMNHG